MDMIVYRVRDAMDRNVIILDEGKTCMDAIKAMMEKKVWSVVVSRNGLPVGVVTERDIIRRVISKGRDVNRVRLGDIMSTPLVTIGPDEPIGRAMELMVTKEIRRIYVVEEGRIIGRITQTEAFRHILNVLMTLSQI